MQALVQQSLAQAEVAQRALARQVEKESEAQAGQVRDLSGSEASRAADVFEPGPGRLKSGPVSTRPSPPKSGTPEPRGRIDLRV